MTGAEFYLQLQQKYDKAYSQYLDTTKANRLIKEAMYRLVDKISQLMDSQKEFDELSELIRFDQNIVVSATVASQPADYYHLLRLSFLFVDEIDFSSISGAIVTASKHGLRPGDKISSAFPAVAAIVTKVTSTTFTLDTVISPPPTNLYLIREFEASPSTSDRKKPSLSKGKKENPKYWTASSGNNRVFYLEPVPYSVELDYVRIPPVDIDTQNTTTVLTDTYTTKFLYRLMDECVYSVASETRDYQNKQSAQQTIIENP
jgi:hypothetical protein